MEELTRSLCRQVSDGTYVVDARAVAAALLRRRPDIAAVAAERLSATQRGRVDEASPYASDE